MWRSHLSIMQPSVGNCSRTAPGCVHTTGCSPLGNECSRKCVPWVAAPAGSSAHPRASLSKGCSSGPESAPVQALHGLQPPSVQIHLLHRHLLPGHYSAKQRLNGLLEDHENFTKTAQSKFPKKFRNLHACIIKLRFQQGHTLSSVPSLWTSHACNSFLN